METDRGDAPFDCLVVGAGPAGLVAAMYLARYRRHVRLVDAGASRLARVPRAHNVLGFPEGIPGDRLLQRLRLQAARYRVVPEQGQVAGLQRVGDAFIARVGEAALHARRVILCTGGQDVEPAIEGLAEGLQCGLVRYCPVCDGFETRHQRVGVMGPGDHGLREALFVAGFDNHVLWLSMGSAGKVTGDLTTRAAQAGIRVEDGMPARIACEGAAGVAVSLHDGRVLRLDTLYPALGQLHACGLATALGARAAADGQLEVDAHQQTTVPGLYAAGDVACGLNQVNVAAGHAAIAATAVHNGL